MESSQQRTCMVEGCWEKADAWNQHQGLPVVLPAEERGVAGPSEGLLRRLAGLPLGGQTSTRSLAVTCDSPPRALVYSFLYVQWARLIRPNPHQPQGDVCMLRYLQPQPVD